MRTQEQYVQELTVAVNDLYNAAWRVVEVGVTASQLRMIWTAVLTQIVNELEAACDAAETGGVN